MLTKTVKIDQSEGKPGAGIPEPAIKEVLQALLPLLPPPPRPRFVSSLAPILRLPPLFESLKQPINKQISA